MGDDCELFAFDCSYHCFIGSRICYFAAEKIVVELKSIEKEAAETDRALDRILKQLGVAK